MILNKHVDISDGFIITATNEITTQCDVIVYNSDVSPIIADGFARMFPAEEVRMIGEVKSTLSKQEFKAALRKMAMNKRVILEGRQGIPHQPHGRESETYNTVISFLVCNRLSFDFSTLTNAEIYEGIDRKYWHNAILSIEDLLMGYVLDFNAFSPKVRKMFEKEGIKTDLLVAWSYPIYECSGEKISTRPNHVHMKQQHKYAHIKRFCADMAACCNDVWTYTYEPVQYLGMTIDSIYDTTNRGNCE